MRLIITLIFFFNWANSFSQYKPNKATLKWYFPKNAGLDFSGDTVKFLNGSQIGPSESSSIICDSTGNILFYTDGIKLWNKYNAIVKNSNNIGFGLSNVTNTSRQGAILLKHPENDSLVFLFCSDYQGRSGGLTYSIINTHANKDSAEVIAKKIKLTNEINEPITAVNHQNGRDIWIVCHGFKNDYLQAFLLTKYGVTKCPVSTQIGTLHTGQFGDGGSAQVGMKFSPNGKYIVTEQRAQWRNEVFRFNQENGLFYDTVYSKEVDLCAFTSFSPNNKLLYFVYYDTGLVQFDIEQNKRTYLYKPNLLPNQLLREIQLGPDGKIYGVIYQGRDILVINKPNVPGVGCDIQLKKNILSAGLGGDQALPNFNQSYFYTPSSDYQYEMNCYNNTISFKAYDTIGATGYTWNIYKPNGNLEASYSNKQINHAFADTGIYKVVFVADNGSMKDTVTKSIRLYNKISKNFLGKDTIYTHNAIINQTLKAPTKNIHCYQWQDNSGFSTFTADTVGTFVCKITTAAFCEVWDTIVIRRCINSLLEPSIYRSHDTLFTYHQQADSFVWFRNNTIYKISKTPFIKLTDTGTYRVEAAKKHHCNRSSINWAVNKLNLTSLQLSDFNIKLYPNPSNETVFINADRNYLLQITDISGKVILKQDNPVQISLPKGVYFFMFEVNGYRVAEKVIIL
ncbi:MAG TPA: T9SS type A sorting domain-containing protein [Bacteroidia bacterium]